MTDVIRCGWSVNSPMMMDYHDHEWGVPLHDDTRLFEFLILEGAQAGLSWSTILKKRENYRKATNDFNPAIIAGYGENKIQSLLQNPGIVRNQLKVRSMVINARAFFEVQEEFGSFDAYIWQFVGGKTIQNQWATMGDLPATTTEAEAMSKDLKKRSFKFVGPTICYAFMQATGLVNDHTTDCFRYRQLLIP